MKRLVNVHYTGFALGLRVAQSFAVECNVKSAVGKAGLHAIKGLVNVTELTREVRAVGINGNLFMVGK